MAEVGTNQGSVYTGVEGQGKAFILPEGDDAMNAFLKLMDEQKQLGQAKQLEKAANQKPPLKDRLKNEIPEHWHRYDSEIQGDTDRLFKLGTELMAAGIEDPFASTNSGAQLFQQEVERLKSMSKLSMQLKGQYASDREKILADKDNKFTEDSKNNLVDWYDQKTLAERLKEGELPPRLFVKDPKFDLAKHYGMLAGDLGKNNPDPKEQDFQAMIQMAFSDPANEGFKDALITEFENVKKDPTQFKLLEAQANAAKQSPIEFLATSQLKSYFGKEPIDINKLIQSYMPATDVYGQKYEGEDHVTTATDSTYLKPEKLSAAAKAVIDFNPRLLDQMQADGLIQGKDMNELAANAQTYIENLMKAQTQTSFKTSTTRDKEGYMGTGAGEKEVKDDMDIWYKAISGGLGETAAEKYRNQKKAMEYMHEVEDEHGRKFVGGRIPSASVGSMKWSDETDYDPNRLIFSVTTPEDITYDEEVWDENKKKHVPTGKKVKGKRYNNDRIEFQFNDKGKENYFSENKGWTYYIEARKKTQGRSFASSLKEEGDDYQGDRNASLKQQELGVLPSPTKNKESETKGILNPTPVK